MKRIFFTVAAVLFLATCLAFIACSPADYPLPGKEQVGPGVNGSGDPGDDTLNNPGANDNEDTNDPMSASLKITVGGRVFSAALEDNAAARAFAALLPMTVAMGDVNGNEKCYYLNGSLPVNSSRPGTIRTGDLMLWGDNCVVLFYETFSSSYRYTRIGRVNDPSGLASALGKGSVTVTFGR